MLRGGTQPWVSAPHPRAPATQVQAAEASGSHQGALHAQGTEPLGPAASLLPCNAQASGPGQVAVQVRAVWARLWRQGRAVSWEGPHAPLLPPVVMHPSPGPDVMLSLTVSSLSYPKGAPAGCRPPKTQVTGALRNLAVAPAHAPAFLAAPCLGSLKAVLRVLGGQQEVVLNVGRVLSKLSLCAQCQVRAGAGRAGGAGEARGGGACGQRACTCTALGGGGGGGAQRLTRASLPHASPPHTHTQAALEADTEFAPLLLGLLHRHKHHRPLLLRLAFALGNLTTLSNAYRQQVRGGPPRGAALLCALLCTARAVRAAPGACTGSPVLYCACPAPLCPPRPIRRRPHPCACTRT